MSAVAQPSDLIRVESELGFQVWTLGAPPVNALSPELIDDLDDALSRAERDDDVAVILVTSELRVFSAGADATWMAETIAAVGIDGLISQFVATMDQFRSFCVRLRQSPVLSIAVLEGHVLAGGLELAAACDLRFSVDSERVRIGVPEMDLFGALPSGGGGVQFLNRLMRPSRALDFVLDAKPITPRRAFDMGLVDRLLSVEDVRAASRAYAQQVAEKAGRIGVAAAKRAVLTGAELPFHEAQEFDRAVHWDALRRGYFRRGVHRFMEQFASGDARPGVANPGTSKHSQKENKWGH